MSFMAKLLVSPRISHIFPEIVYRLQFYAFMWNISKKPIARTQTIESESDYFNALRVASLLFKPGPRFFLANIHLFDSLLP